MGIILRAINMFILLSTIINNMDLITQNINIYPILISLALGLSLPLIGVFVILRREALLSDALSHVVLLGIALAMTLKLMY